MAKKNNVKLLSIIIKFFCLITAFAILTISKYAFMFFIFAMLPAITSVTIDRRINKYASSTVCAFNLIGVMPFLFNLLKSTAINDMAQTMLTNSYIWFSIYGCTSLGWLLIWCLPKFTSKIFLARTRFKIKSIKDEQDKLIEEWGLQVQSK